MPITYPNDGQPLVIYTGGVLATRRGTYRVSSDRAMLDSGETHEVRVWDAQHGVAKWISIDVDSCPVIVVDADEATQSLAAEYEAVVFWLRHNRGEVYAAQKWFMEVKRGDRVEVYKGRKAPNGTYEVVRVGDGQYGPYYNLRADDGKYFNYISVGNCRKAGTPNYSSVEEKYREFFLAAEQYPSTYPHYSKDEYFAVLADKLEEDGDPRHVHTRNFALNSRK